MEIAHEEARKRPSNICGDATLEIWFNDKLVGTIIYAQVDGRLVRVGGTDPCKSEREARAKAIRESQIIKDWTDWNRRVWAYRELKPDTTADQADTTA
jgi:hypothetical protein